jgi:hypothetical protein
MDEQHKKLFVCVNDLGDAMRAVGWHSNQEVHPVKAAQISTVARL